MEEWELDFEWLKVRHLIKDNLDGITLPDLNAILFLIGVQELGFVKESFTKEEKQDLMHIAVCQLLSEDGLFEFVGNDADGWPHWRQTAHLSAKGAENQERLLKEKIIRYFRQLEED